jgi:hypothetical protein
VKYADDLLLLAKEETVLQGMTYRLFEVGKFCGMEMNAEETKVRRISRQKSAAKIMIDKKQAENVEYWNYLGKHDNK